MLSKHDSTSPQCEACFVGRALVGREGIDKMRSPYPFLFDHDPEQSHGWRRSCYRGDITPSASWLGFLSLQGLSHADGAGSPLAIVL